MVLGPDTVVGAVLKVLLTELWEKVKKLRAAVKGFESELSKLEETLEDLHPRIQEMDRLNTLLRNLESVDRSEEVVERLKSILEDGNKLVSECHAVSKKRSKFKIFSKIKGVFKKEHYQRKLMELDNKLTKFTIKFIQMDTYLEARKTRLEQRQGINELKDHIAESRRSFISSLDNGLITPSSLGTSMVALPMENGTTSVPAIEGPTNTRAPNIGILGSILFVVHPGIHFIFKITAIFIIMHKAITAIMSESIIYMFIKDVALLKSTIEELKDTMTSLVRVLKEIEAESNEEVAMMDEEKADRSEAAKSLRDLLQEGEILVFESSKMGWGNFNKKWEYQMKMVELENKLLKFHRSYLRSRLAQNRNTTRDDHVSEMKDNKSFVPHDVEVITLLLIS